MTQHDLRGKTALVTGAAKRIGREIALALADEGANVVLHHHQSVDEAAELAARLSERGVKVWTLRADLGDAAECEALIGRSLEVAGALDMLINNASIFPRNRLRDVSFADLTRNMHVNAWAPFVLCREFARLVGRGKIVNLLDSRIRGYDRVHVAYILSKHVFAVLTKMMALEFAPEMSVNGVAPGLVLAPPGRDDSYLDRLAHTAPLKRHGQPSDVAEAVIYLLKSDFVTGQVIYVDGGRHLREHTT